MAVNRTLPELSARALQPVQKSFHPPSVERKRLTHQGLSALTVSFYQATERVFLKQNNSLRRFTGSPTPPGPPSSCCFLRLAVDASFYEVSVNKKRA